jgi:L-ribulokinase
VRVLTYTPNPQSAATYARLYPLYKALHDAFGSTGRTVPLAGVMKELLELRDRVRTATTPA